MTGPGRSAFWWTTVIPVPASGRRPAKPPAEPARPAWDPGRYLSGDGYIYVIGTGTSGVVKIGFSLKPHADPLRDDPGHGALLKVSHDGRRRVSARSQAPIPAPGDRAGLASRRSAKISALSAARLKLPR